MTLDDAIQIHSTKMRSPDDVHSLYAQWFIELRNLRIYVEKLKDKNRELQGMLNNIPDEVIEEYNEAGDGDLQKAISYVIGDKFGMFEGL